MQGQTIYQISLIAAFIAGMVALFAPCCISYLLPAYFGNIFKEKKQIFFMTFIYSLGIFFVMLPIVLGAKFLSDFFFKFHDQSYLAGGVFLLIISIVSLLGIKLPMPMIGFKQKHNKNDTVSTFVLGVFSGITSACCAPVLIGVVTLSTLSPTIFQSLLVGVFYVLGMVAPLYLASVFIEKGNILEKPLMRKKLTVLNLGKRKYPIFFSNIVAFLVFFLTGSLTLILLSLGKLSMSVGNSSIIKSINNTAFYISQLTRSIWGLDFIFLSLIIYLLYIFLKKIKK